MLAERPIPAHFAEEFKENIAAVAAANNLTPEQVYCLWHKYSSDCNAADQSAIMAEFLQWYREQLPNLPEGMHRLGGR